MITAQVLEGYEDKLPVETGEENVYPNGVTVNRQNRARPLLKIVKHTEKKTAEVIQDRLSPEAKRFFSYIRELIQKCKDKKITTINPAGVGRLMPSFYKWIFKVWIKSANQEKSRDEVWIEIGAILKKNGINFNILHGDKEKRFKWYVAQIIETCQEENIKIIDRKWVCDNIDEGYKDAKILSRDFQSRNEFWGKVAIECEKHGITLNYETKRKPKPYKTKNSLESYMPEFVKACTEAKVKNIDYIWIWENANKIAKYMIKQAKSGKSLIQLQIKLITLCEAYGINLELPLLSPKELAIFVAKSHTMEHHILAKQIQEDIGMKYVQGWELSDIKKKSLRDRMQACEKAGKIELALSYFPSIWREKYKYKIDTKTVDRILKETGYTTNSIITEELLTRLRVEMNKGNFYAKIIADSIIDFKLKNDSMYYYGPDTESLPDEPPPNARTSPNQAWTDPPGQWITRYAA